MNLEQNWIKKDLVCSCRLSPAEILAVSGLLNSADPVFLDALIKTDVFSSISISSLVVFIGFVRALTAGNPFQPSASPAS